MTWVAGPDANWGYELAWPTRRVCVWGFCFLVLRLLFAYRIGLVGMVQTPRVELTRGAPRLPPAPHSQEPVDSIQSNGAFQTTEGQPV